MSIEGCPHGPKALIDRCKQCDDEHLAEAAVPAELTEHLTRLMAERLDKLHPETADKTPMERDYPTICKWTRHQTVSTEALRDELEKALAWLDAGEPRCLDEAP